MQHILRFPYKERACTTLLRPTSFLRRVVLWAVFLWICGLTCAASADLPKSKAQTKPSGHHYKLTVSEDDKLCHYMLNVLNRNKTQVDEPDDRVFKAINWTQYGILNDKSYDYSAQYAKFDINNDGRNELVVRFRSSSFHSIDADFLFIFPENFSIKSLHQAKELELHSSGSVEIGREGYELRLLPPLPHEGWMKADKQYFPSLTSSILAHPFLFNHKYYLLLSEPPDVRIDPELLVVTRYVSGHVSSADSSEMSDVCYFSRPRSNPTIKRY